MIPCIGRAVIGVMGVVRRVVSDVRRRVVNRQVAIVLAHLSVVVGGSLVVVGRILVLPGVVRVTLSRVRIGGMLIIVSRMLLPNCPILLVVLLLGLARVIGAACIVIRPTGGVRSIGCVVTSSLVIAGLRVLSFLMLVLLSLILLVGGGLQ